MQRVVVGFLREKKAEMRWRLYSQEAEYVWVGDINVISRPSEGDRKVSTREDETNGRV